MKRGDKVVCVDGRLLSNNSDGFLVDGKIYIIDSISGSEDFEDFYYFEGRPGRRFSTTRFISLKDARQQKLRKIQL